MRQLSYKQAVKIAIQCIDREIQRLAVEANLHEKYNAMRCSLSPYPAAISAAARRKKLNQAKKVLTSEILFTLK